MRSEEFWDLTWYELMGWMGHVNRKTQIRREDRELSIELQRSWMAFYGNGKLGKNQTPFKPQDFFRLSYDETIHEVAKLEKGQLMKEMKERFAYKKKK